MAGIVVSFGVVVIFVRSFICRPFSRQWDPEQAGECGDERAAILGDSVIDAIVNLVIICIPMPILWRLQMAVEWKVMLTIVFGVGSMYVGHALFVLHRKLSPSMNHQSAPRFP